MVALVSNLFSSICTLRWQRCKILSLKSNKTLNWKLGREGHPMLATLPKLRERGWVMVQMPQILVVLTEF